MIKIILSGMKLFSKAKIQSSCHMTIIPAAEKNLLEIGRNNFSNIRMTQNGKYHPTLHPILADVHHPQITCTAAAVLSLANIKS